VRQRQVLTSAGMQPGQFAAGAALGAVTRIMPGPAQNGMLMNGEL
jgi:hypothetical protein